MSAWSSRGGMSIEPRRCAARAFERGEELVHRRELDVVREHAGALQLVDERIEVDARAVRDVRGRGEEPERREPEREDRAELDDVPRALADGELPGRGLELACDLSFRALDAADELDGDPQEVLRGRLVQPRAADEPWQHELRRLVDRPSGSRGERAKRRSGSETTNVVARRTALALVGISGGGGCPDRDPAERGCALNDERGRLRVLRHGHVVRHAAEERSAGGDDAPLGRHLDVDTAEERADREPCVRRELRLGQIDRRPRRTTRISSRRGTPAHGSSGRCRRRSP